MTFSKQIVIAFILLPLLSIAQGPKQMTSGELYEALEQFNFLGNALFVAAHPDDENTRLISYLVNEVNAHTTYLSLTRGDGGQNLIGPEISELLGVIRTQELLAARRTDGGHQMFTRANDFGYSKSPEETINIWDNDLVKHDVVWAIRKLRPDVIVNRFDHSGDRRTHGHHTASAMLSHALFEAASDPKAYPEQLKYVDAWSPRRLFFNTSWWFYGSREKFAEVDKSDMMSVDVGTYYPLLGKSNNEIAAQSRSNHKCQGFGSTGDRGSQLEYIKLLKGDMPVDKENIFDGINTSWSRVKGGDKIQSVMDEVMSNFDHAHPNSSLQQLVKVYNMIDDLEDDFWKTRKKKELEGIIASSLGMYVDAVSNTSSTVPGSEITIEMEITKRLNGDVTLVGIKINPAGKDTTLNITLGDNESYYQNATYQVDKNSKYTAPYWLEEQGSLGMYKVNDPTLIGLPETPRPIQVKFDFEVNGQPFSIIKDVTFKYNSPENGEVYQPFEITPEIFVDVQDKVYVFDGARAKKVNVTVQSGANDQSGQVSLPLPKGWNVSPINHEFSLKEKGESKTFTFNVTPPSNPDDIIASPVATANGRTYNKKVVKIDYDHIPLQTVLMPAKSRLVNIDVQRAGSRIAYIMGAGDEVPQSMRQIGYNVTELTLNDINIDILQTYDALVLGVRAYNTLNDIKFKQATFMEYVKQGGTMIVQYNTNRRLNVDNIGPYPIRISRDRVSVEEAEMRVLLPDHEVMNYPNKITSADFDGWVQERGLYYADEWSSEYQAILSANDPGEDPKDGGLLIAKHGDGHFVYTGISWFRELPAGVPGAYRLFANILSLGSQQRP